MHEPGRKADADRIIAHLDALAQSDWIGARKWWPKYVFHFAELQNTVSILENHELRARSLQPMAVYTASPSVMAHTAQEWQDHVRFYFRPRTPTQRQCEGFRPPGEYGSAGAHSPMPFFFLFDSKEVLTRATTRFSNGNLSKRSHPQNRVGDTADFFERLPFNEIYHDSAFAPEDRDRIINRRHAEVIVPERMNLGALRYIWCRSAAEYHTLVNSISPQARKTYLSKIGTGEGGQFHNRLWTFVEDVTSEQNRAVFHFNPSTLTPGPFAANITLQSTAGTLVWENPGFMAESSFTLNIPQYTLPTDYDIALTLNGDRAYLGRFISLEGFF